MFIILKEPHETLNNKKTDWEGLKNFIDINVNLQLPLKKEKLIEETVLYATNLIQTAAWLSTSTLKCTSHKYDIKNKNLKSHH